MGRSKSSAASGLAALFILCIACLVLFTVYVKEGDCTDVKSGCGPLHTVQLGAAEVLRPARSLTAAITKPFSETSKRIGGALNHDEEEKLQREARKNAELASQASNLERENARLRELLKGQRSVYKYGPLARVIAPVGDQFTNRVTINVGADDGIKPEQPVVVGNNTLVGRTTGQVSRHTAEVMLVTDQMFAAGVRILPPAQFDPSSGELTPAVTDENVSYGEGMLRTNWEGYLGVDYVDLSSRAKKGDFVVTSGRAGDYELLFPPGLLIGKIESASAQDINQYKKIVVTPAARPDDLQEVRVIVDW
ncbi:MAG TPA: rod shape-determining protein MreC [Rubrobacteraceae bacterium]|nr:rod shape-determining protein MreC [Rubrobacteraceae bacterium]